MISIINHPSNGGPNISNWSLESNGQFSIRNDYHDIKSSFAHEEEPCFIFSMVGNWKGCEE